MHRLNCMVKIIILTWINNITEDIGSVHSGNLELGWLKIKMLSFLIFKDIKFYEEMSVKFRNVEKQEICSF